MILEESDAEEVECTTGLQGNYNYLLEKSGEYTRVAKAAVKKMKKAKEDYRSLLVRYKKAKCEIEMLNGELTEAYTKVIFLELEVVQANAKVEWVSTKKLDDVLSHQKPFFDKTRLGYTRESSSAVNISKEVKFVKAKERVVVAPTMEMAKVKKKKNVADQRVLNKPVTNLWSSLKPKRNLFQDHKEVRERTMFVTIVDFKGTPDWIVIS